MAEEKVFLDAPDLKVTSSRLVVAGNTYALSAITSFRRQTSEVSQTSKGMLVFWIMFFLMVVALPGAVMLFAGVVGMGIGQLLIGAACAYAAFTRLKQHRQRFLHTIVLAAASGEMEAYRTEDGELAQRVEVALTHAVVQRG